MPISKQALIDLTIVLSIPIFIIGGQYMLGGEGDGAQISANPSAALSLDEPGAKTKLALDTLSKINLKGDIFTDNAYTRLVALDVIIPEVDLSREFPFSPPPIIEERLRQARLGNSAGKVWETPTTSSDSSDSQSLSNRIDQLKKTLK
jgi:hypothetical protein